MEVGAERFSFHKYDMETPAPKGHVLIVCYG